MKRHNLWFAFEPNRWLSNEKLALVSLGAKGLWIHLLCLAYKANEGGRLVINGITPTTEQIGRMVGEDATKLLDELETAGVFTRKDGAIYHAVIEKGLVKMNHLSDIIRVRVRVRVRVIVRARAIVTTRKRERAYARLSLNGLLTQRRLGGQRQTQRRLSFITEVLDG